MSKVDRAEFTIKFHEGLNRLELAAYFECAPQRVSVIRKELDLPAFKGTQRWVTPERLATIEAMLDDGMSFSEIHRTEGVSQLTLQKLFPGRAWTMEQSVELRNSLRNSNRSIRKQFNTNRLTVVP